jgi:hypothetical protein
LEFLKFVVFEILEIFLTNFGIIPEIPEIFGKFPATCQKFQNNINFDMWNLKNFTEQICVGRKVDI